MKKISLTFAFIGIMSAATFANTFSTPQEGSKGKKVEKAQPSSTPKTESTQKVEPGTQRVDAKQNQQSAKPATPQASSSQNQKEQDQTAKPASHRPLKKAGVARPAIKAMPAAEVQKSK